MKATARWQVCFHLAGTIEAVYRPAATARGPSTAEMYGGMGMKATVMRQLCFHLAGAIEAVAIEAVAIEAEYIPAATAGGRYAAAGTRRWRWPCWPLRSGSLAHICHGRTPALQQKHRLHTSACARPHLPRSQDRAATDIDCVLQLHIRQLCAQRMQDSTQRSETINRTGLRHVTN